MTDMPPWRIAGFCFDHMHMGDLLAAALATSAFEVVGTYDTDAARMASVCADLGIHESLQYDDWERLVDEARPDVAIVCSPTTEHGMWAERMAERGIHVLLEKPFAVSTNDARRAIHACEQAGVQLAINWPLAWYPPHRTSRRLIEDGAIGNVTEVHYYDGNRGPQYHLHAKKAAEPPHDPTGSWWFSREAGGGSLLDYLGYGVTLATWFRDGELPSELAARTHVPAGYEVDLQSVVVATYEHGLSTFQTRWGTFTDPWLHQPQPACGFVIVGTEGTIASRDYADSVTVQTREHPAGRSIAVDAYAHNDDIFGHIDAALRSGVPVTGPCGWEVSLGGQRIVDAAVRGAETGQPVRLAELEATR